nr:hypothetical protein [Tanacetum cinerariifolium]
AKEKLEVAARWSSHNREEKKRAKEDDQESKDEVKETIDWAAIGTMIKDGADDPISCAKVCKEVEDCLQWRHTVKGDGECHLSK